MTVEERRKFVKENDLCFNCLQSGHPVAKCLSRHNCKSCSKRHHSSLHVGSVDGKGVKNSKRTGSHLARQQEPKVTATPQPQPQTPAEVPTQTPAANPEVNPPQAVEPLKKTHTGVAGAGRADVSTDNTYPITWHGHGSFRQLTR